MMNISEQTKIAMWKKDPRYTEYKNGAEYNWNPFPNIEDGKLGSLYERFKFGHCKEGTPLKVSVAANEVFGKWYYSSELPVVWLY